MYEAEAEWSSCNILLKKHLPGYTQRHLRYEAGKESHGKSAKAIFLCDLSHVVHPKHFCPTQAGRQVGRLAGATRNETAATFTAIVALGAGHVGTARAGLTRAQSASEATALESALSCGEFVSLESRFYLGTHMTAAGDVDSSAAI